MQKDAAPGDVKAIITAIEAKSLKALEMPGGDHVAIGIPSAIPPDVRSPLFDLLSMMPGVSSVVHITRSYKLASREFHAANTIVKVGEAEFGGNECTVIAGPCAIESREQILASAQIVKAAGAKMLRGGAFKPRTSPYSFQGLHQEGLELMQEAAKAVGIATVTEVVDSGDVETVKQYVDMLQIGARNMQNFPLLIAAGKSMHPVLLKRGPSASLDEFLLAAEYILHQGNPNVVLCERGVHPLDRTYTRNTLDLNAIPVLKEMTHLPVIADPSHGIGIARFVPAMSLASVAAGADGLIVEMHPNPREAMSDGQQSLTPEQFSSMMNRLQAVASAVGKA
jgi:3-deoxy-7-phosphoheptulonate synthase